MTDTAQLIGLLDHQVLQIGQIGFTLGELLVVAGCVVITLFAAWLLISVRNAKRRAVTEAAALERAREAEARMAELVASQNELTGRMQTMSEIFSTRQGDMMRTVNERLENMSGRIGQSISETTKNTQESLANLQERLAVIDTAQNNITSLAGQVVELQNILSNKQTRGAFGEGRMQQIVQDGLPIGSFEFQAKLSNDSRPDCLISMPNDTPSLVIDAKFPLEAWHAIRDAETLEQSKTAAQAFRRDVEVHLKAIAEKYLIKGETQDTAFMFVPSESIFAEIHENFEGLVQKAHRLRVVIVSPSLLMLSIQVIQSVLKDTRMREQAHLIQGEVIRLMEDVGRLDERVRKLAGHFGQAQKDVDMILTSSEKVTKRGNKIADLEFEEPQAVLQDEQPRLKAVE
ncbi:MAG: DNA recombination protein RmuC [Pseudomonadota bacterium]